MVSGTARWNSGRIYTWDGLSASPGFRQGDGVFETLRTYRGIPFQLRQHIDRLLEGARLIGLKNLPGNETIEDKILGQIAEQKSEIDRTEYILRFALFHEDIGWGFAISVTTWDPVRVFSHGDSLWTGYSSYQHPGRYLTPPGSQVQIKWLSRGPLAHALRDAKAMGWDEGILLNQYDEAVEGTRSNIFAVADGIIFAPGPKSYALPGITREIAVECATELGLKVVDQPVPKGILEVSDEIFLTSSLLGIAPVSKIVNGSYSSKSNGKVTNSLMKLFIDTILEG